MKQPSLFKKTFQEKNIHAVFEASVVIKGMSAILEIIGGFIVPLISPQFLVHTVLFFFQDELGEPSRHVIASHLINSAQHFSIHTQHFLMFYLLSHGIVKLILVIGLLKEKTWAYPASLGIFALFILYQLFRLFVSYSTWLMMLTILNLCLLWLVWHEYRTLQSFKNGKSFINS